MSAPEDCLVPLDRLVKATEPQPRACCGPTQAVGGTLVRGSVILYLEAQSENEACNTRLQQL